MGVGIGSGGRASGVNTGIRFQGAAIRGLSRLPARALAQCLAEATEQRWVGAMETSHRSAAAAGREPCWAV
jgi:hypothetical protein